jgi:small subunit ribosomal protein S10
MTAKITPPTPSIRHQTRHVHETGRKAATPAKSSKKSTNELVTEIQTRMSQIRLPKAVQATYLAPLRRTPTHDIPCVDLQLRSYSVRNLEVYADFAMRAAYYLGLPAKGPSPLRRIVERWTVPRSNFVHKKSQENFERQTLRRWIRIVDGHPETVNLWLAYLRKHQYYGVGMKANVYENSSLDAAKAMDEEGVEAREVANELVNAFSPGTKDAAHAEDLLFEQQFKGAYGAFSAMGGAQKVPDARNRMPKMPVETAEDIEEEKEAYQSAQARQRR